MMHFRERCYVLGAMLGATALLITPVSSCTSADPEAGETSGGGGGDGGAGSNTSASGGAGGNASAGGSSAGGSTPTDAPFTFALYGDTRSGGGCEGNAEHIGVVEQLGLDDQWSFLFNLGDMVTGYDSSTCFVADGDCSDTAERGNFSEMIKPLRMRTVPSGLATNYFPVIGNHDDNNGWYPDPCGGEICDVFDMPSLVNHATPNDDPCGADYPESAYYSFQYQGSLFIVLRINSDYFDLFECNGPPDGYDSCASYCGEAPASAERTDRCWNVHQYDWLKAELASAENDPAIQHRFVMLHAPIYTSYDDHSAVASDYILTPLFDEYGVDMVFSGHNHTYERTVPIAGGVEAAGGSIYITSGLGGGQGGLPDGDWFTAASSGDFHYVRISVDGSNVAGEAINQNGDVIDTF